MEAIFVFFLRSAGGIDLLKSKLLTINLNLPYFFVSKWKERFYNNFKSFHNWMMTIKFKEVYEKKKKTFSW